MITIDLDKIREALPERAKVSLTKKQNQDGRYPVIECFIPGDALDDEDFKMCKQWQEELLGDSILTFHVEVKNRHWLITLKRILMEFVNCEDENVNSFIGTGLLENGDIKK